MFKSPFAALDFRSPFGTAAMKRSRDLFGTHTTPREWKHGARDIPFGMGAASLYVDGTNGSDSNDGESWKTAKTTIQETIDTADSWTDIYIKSGTYAENVIINNESVRLIGEHRNSVIVSPTSGLSIRLTSDNCTLTQLTTKTNAHGATGIYAEGDAHKLISILLDTSVTAALEYVGGITAIGDENIIHNIKSISPNRMLCMNVNGDYNNIDSCFLQNAGEGGIKTIGTGNKISQNIVSNCTYGIICQSATSNSIFHNNLLGNTSQAAIYSGSNNKFYENFYDDHTNIDNGHGIATTPYAFTGGSDPRPVVVRNGWNSISILRSLLRKKTAAQTTQAATNANGTAWVDLKTIAPTTSDIELYQLKMTVAGSWAGNAKYRIIVGSTKVYPFPADKNITSGTLESLIFPINIQINETAKIQFRSDNAGDGAGDTVTLDQLDYATVL